VRPAKPAARAKQPNARAESSAAIKNCSLRVRRYGAVPGPSALLGLLEAAGAKGLTCPQLFSTRSRIICRAAARSVELPSSELIARLLLSELANAARGETDQKRKDRKRMEAEQLASWPREIRQDGKGIPAVSRLGSELNPSPFLQAPVRARRGRIRASRRMSTPAVPRS